MNKYLKYSLFAAAGVVALFFFAILVVSLSFDPNSYKPQLVKLVQEKKQRTLAVPGDIKLTFFPRLGVIMGPVSLGEYQGGGTFASVESARFYLSWWSLLRKELVVDQVRVAGLRARLMRFKDGSTNFDDLLKKDDEPRQFRFDIDSVKATGGEVVLRDDMTGQRFMVSRLDVTTGRLANGQPTRFAADFSLEGSTAPSFAAQIHLASGLQFDSESGQFSLKGANLEITGEAAGWRDLALGVKGDLALSGQALRLENLAFAVAGIQGADELDVRLTAPLMEFSPERLSMQKILLVAKMQPSATSGRGARGGGQDESSMVLTVPSLAGTHKSFRADMSFEANIRQGESVVVAKLDGPLAGNLEASRLEWPGLKINVVVSNPKAPKGGIKSDLTGTAMLDLKQQAASLNASGRVDDSSLKLRLGVAPLANPHFNFDIGIDQIDGDRYLSASGSSSAQQQPGKGMDFSAPLSLSADGVLHVGLLKLFNAKASNLRLEIRADDGRLNVSPFSMVEPVLKDRAQKELKTRLGDELKRQLFPR